MPDWARGSTNVEHEIVVCMSLVNILPTAARKASSEHNTRFSKDLRGEAVPLGIEELVVLGCRSGCLIFLDTMNDCRIAHVMQAHQLQVDQLHYRHVRQELFTLGEMSSEKGAATEFSEARSVIRVWSMPSLQCVCEVKGLAHVSPQNLYPNAFSISEYLPFFAVGCTDGDIRVFVVMPQLETRAALSKDSSSTDQGGSGVRYGIGEGPAVVGLPSAGSRSAAEKFRIAPGTDVSLVGFGYMEAMLRSGDNHAATVTAISFCDELQLYASASADKVVKIWTCEKQIVSFVSNRSSAPRPFLCDAYK
jgi:WD40 repeat protein